MSKTALSHENVKQIAIYIETKKYDSQLHIVVGKLRPYQMSSY